MTWTAEVPTQVLWLQAILLTIAFCCLLKIWGICNLEGHCQIVLHTSFPSCCSHQQRVSVLDSPPTLCWVKLFDLCQSDRWTWYLCVVLTWVFFKLWVRLSIFSSKGHLISFSIAHSFISFAYFSLWLHLWFVLSFSYFRKTSPWWFKLHRSFPR